MKTETRLPSLPVAFDLKQRMIHLLMFRANFLKNPGLLSGKMGIVLFFAHYHKVSSVDIYESIADELLEQILERVHKELPIGLEAGLSGIGWGMEYLIQNGFIEGNGVDICEEIDHKIMEKDPRRITDFSLETGLEGILHYVLVHIGGAFKNRTVIPFDKTYLDDLYRAVSLLYEKKENSQGLIMLADCYVKFYKEGVINYKLTLNHFIYEIEVNERKLTTYPVGLKEGITGVLLNLVINI